MSRTSSQERTELALAKVINRESFAATFVGMVGNKAQVVHNDSIIEVRTTGQYAFVPGDVVRVDVAGADVVVAGPTVPKSATGRVSAIGSPYITVEYPNGSGVTRSMSYVTSYTPTLNDAVQISWDAAGGPTVLGKLSALPSSVSPTLPATPPRKKVQLLLTAQDSGSFQYGRWGTMSVYASTERVGAWFYGSKIKDSIPDTATILAASIYLPATKVYGNAPNFGYHNQPSKPAGTVTVTAAAPLGGRSGWVPLPTSIIDYLKANNGGIGVDHGGYNIWSGVDVDGLSGALNITYQTS